MPANDQKVAELRTGMHEMWGKMRVHIDESDARRDAIEGATDWSAEDREIYDKMLADYRAIETQLQRELDMAEIERKMATPVNREDAPTGLSIEDRMLDGMSELEGQLRHWARSGQCPDGTMRNMIELPLRSIGEADNQGAEVVKSIRSRRIAGQGMFGDSRALSFTGAQGGFTVGEMEVSRYTVAQARYNSVYTVADVIPTADGRDLPWPMMDDTGNTGRRRAVNAAVNNLDVRFTSETLKAWSYTSDYVVIPLELEQDTQLPLDAIINDALFERIAKVQGEELTNLDGDSGNGPIGVTQWTIPTARTRTLTGANAWPGADAAAYNALVDLKGMVNGAYQAGASWMCNTQIQGDLMKVRDSGGSLVFQLDARNPEFTVILGKPVVVNDFFPGYATNSVFLMYGDFRQYKVREVQVAYMTRLTELFAINRQVAMLVDARLDGRPVSAGASMARLTRGNS